MEAERRAQLHPLYEGDLRGTEHIRPEDKMDVDYGELLEKAENSVKRMASPKRVNPFNLVGSFCAA